MTWETYYERFYDWAESTQLKHISSLTDFGSSDEICEIAENLPNEKAASKLIRKAMASGIEFSEDDVEQLDGVVEAALLEELSALLGGRLSWNSFYDSFYDWSEKLQGKNAVAQKLFGSSAEVCEIAVALCEEDDSTQFVNNALAAGVKFTAEEIIELAGNVCSDTVLSIVETQRPRFSAEQLDDLSYVLGDDDIQEIAEITGHSLSKDSDDEMDDWIEPANSTRRKSGIGFLGGLAIISSLLFGGSKDNKHSGRCNGDCANCPPHYGYRYGRWYYGHHHTRGCQFGGNHGGGGID